MKKSELKQIIREVVEETSQAQRNKNVKGVINRMKSDVEKVMSILANQYSGPEHNDYYVAIKQLEIAVEMLNPQQRQILITRSKQPIQENYHGIMGWIEFATPIQKQKVDELLKKGFKVMHTAFDAGEYGDPGDDKRITVYLTKRSGPVSDALEVDSEGNVN